MVHRYFAIRKQVVIRRADQATRDLFISDQLAFHTIGPWVNPTYTQAAEAGGLKYDFVLLPGIEEGKHGGIQNYEFIGVAPGPRLTKQTPGLPVLRASASAMKPAPLSCRQTTSRTEGTSISASMGSAPATSIAAGTRSPRSADATPGVSTIARTSAVTLASVSPGMVRRSMSSRQLGAYVLGPIPPFRSAAWSDGGPTSGCPADARSRRHLELLGQDFYGSLGIAEGLLGSKAGFPVQAVAAHLDRARTLLPSDAPKQHLAGYFQLRGLLRANTQDKPGPIRDLETAFSLWPVAESGALRPLEQLYRDLGDRAALRELEERVARLKQRR